LTPSLDYGGAEVLIVQLALYLIDTGWRVCVVSMLAPLAFADELTSKGAEVVSLRMEPKGANIAGVVALIREIRRFRPSIIHTHMFHANLLARLLRPALRRPLVCTVHNILESPRTSTTSTLRDLAYRYTDHLCDGTTAVAEAVRARLVQDRLANPTRLWTIPNGVDTNRFAPNSRTRSRVRAEQGWENSFVWLAVGRFELAKDYPTMLRAFKLVRERHSTARLAIAGSGRLEAELRQFVNQTRLTSHIDFLGTRTDIADLLAGCDGYVMSSAWEGAPLALLEACSSALPVVTTDAGGVSEVVVSGENGFIVPIGNVEQLASAMSDIVAATPAHRQHLGERARRRIVEHFSINSTFQGYEQCYSRMLQPRPA
jgi:glycosyltransferase involved in cell wall biosynthesis